MPSSRLIFGVLPWYSALIVAGICVALLLCVHDEKRLALPKDTTVDLALFVLPFGIIGARLYYVAFAWDVFRDHPLEILKIWNGGLAIYGGILGGLAAIALFARLRKVSALTLCDLIVPGLSLAQAIGRWGNFFNMEAYGLPVTNPQWQFFPMAVQIPQGGETVWHMATFFYESVWDVGVFLALWFMRRRVSRRGDMTCWYMLLYGAGRLMIEGLRMDSLMAGDSVRISQLLSVGLCLAVTAIFALRHIRSFGRPQWIAAGIGLLLGVAWLVFAPASADAFPGYRVAFAAELLLCCAALPCLFVCSGLTPRRRLAALLPALFLGLSLLTTCRLADSGASGPETATLLCACFSAVSISLAAWLYPPVSSAAALHKAL